jgi:hypothetical protein
MRLLTSTVFVLLVLAAAGCDRKIEPYADEPVREPDLSRIFPEGAARAARDAGGAMPAPPDAAAGGVPGAPVASGEAAVITGTIRLSPDLEGRVPSGAVLFLIARGEGGGPPMAVRRIAFPSFPLDFAIGPADRMMEGVPFDGPLRLSARVDADGDAMTRNPGDLQGSSAPGLSPGARDVEIVIDEVL